MINEVIGADPRTLEPISHFIMKDKNKVYYGNAELKGADPETIKFLGHFMTKDKNNVYFGEEIIADADPKTFVAVGVLIGKDKNNVYYRKIKLKGLDVKTFKTQLDNPLSLYYSDKNGVYSFYDLYDMAEKYNEMGEIIKFERETK